LQPPHSVDLKKYCKEAEINEHFSRIIQNNAVNGQLVGATEAREGPFFDVLFMSFLASWY
jgi:hypothetical protein